MIFSCSWEPPLNVRGGSESGERLDAQSWHDEGTIVVVGTEDYVALNERLPPCGFAENNYPVKNIADGLEIVVPIAPAKVETSLHFVIAENSFPEPVENSAWHAVDIDHCLLTKRS